MRIIASLLFVALLGSQAGTRRAQSALHEFGTLKTFRCDFTESQGRRTSAAGVTSPAARETFGDLVIDNVDYQRGTARFIGNAGSETVQVLDGERIVSFLELSQTGNPNLLSIFKATGSLDRYKAVYSRHSALSTGDLTTSQSYGICRGMLP